jgi:hypothetical protein
MRTFLFVFVTIVFFACNSQTKNKTSDDPTQSSKTNVIPDCNTAVQFINDYVKFITLENKATNDSTWIEQNTSLTANFKLAYKNLLDSARKADPEMGLDFDPILDAQDFPEKGFELVSCDNTLGYVTVSGKDWKDFFLALKVVAQNDKWLVDGAGVINIPADKRAKR